MSQIKSISVVQTTIELTLSESEAQALIAISSYNIKDFLEVFYKHMGKYYLKPHERGLRSLFETVRKELPQHIHSVEKARSLLRQHNQS